MVTTFLVLLRFGVAAAHGTRVKNNEFANYEKVNCHSHRPRVGAVDNFWVQADNILDARQTGDIGSGAGRVVL